MPRSPNRLAQLPAWASRWLGYRSPYPPSSESDLLPPPRGASKLLTTPPPAPVVWFWSWVGAFSGLAVIQAVFGRVQYFVDRGAAPIVPSYGATAVLVYGVIESPLAQPRNVFCGHLIGAVVGVCVTKLFGLLPTEERFNELAWLAASIACATTIVLMQMTGTAHPPAGATAFIPILDPTQRRLGWYFIPIILLSSTLAISVALITNNVQRRYPLHWISPPPPPAPAAHPTAQNDTAGIVGKLSEKDMLSVSASEVVTGSERSMSADASSRGRSLTPMVMEVR